YNIHKGIGNDRLYRLNRTIEILKHSDADFIMLQEVDHHVPRSRNENTAKIIAEELNYYYSIGLNVKLKKGAYGNATFSKYPIHRSRNLDLTWGIKKARGSLNTHIETPAGEILIMNYHLGLAGIERIWQAKKLIHSAKHQHAHHLPIVILGDSNDRGHKLNPIFKEHGFEDTCQIVNMNTYPSYAPIWRLDKIFYNKFLNLKEHRPIKTKLAKITSDHLPVVTRLQIVSK
ncbi:MAG: endonuclease/exonuclease/phosphatase family protein, partial [Spirochaetia bacterium]|nr:endonuclease/exonuclease/phosphatase family protein [Spirochaetia bacterium]